MEGEEPEIGTLITGCCHLTVHVGLICCPYAFLVSNAFWIVWSLTRNSLLLSSWHIWMLSFSASVLLLLFSGHWLATAWYILRQLIFVLEFLNLFGVLSEAKHIREWFPQRRSGVERNNFKWSIWTPISQLPCGMFFYGSARVHLWCLLVQYVPYIQWISVIIVYMIKNGLLWLF